MKQRLVVVGAGMAAGRMLEHVVGLGGDYAITLINAEPRGSYNRLMLSPVLAGEKTYAEIVTHDAAWYRARAITCRFGSPVTALDPANKQVFLGAEALPYDKLVLATGSQPFILPVAGNVLQGVCTYRDLEDTEAMVRAATQGARAVVIGGGLLGLEAAAGMAARGAQVTVLHLMGHLMERQLDAVAGGLLQADLERRGIRVLCGASTKAILGETSVEAVELTSGEVIPADLVCMAVGIRPETRLAASAGLAVGRGIIVDAQMRSSAPEIYALGECVEFEGQTFGLVAPLYEQAQVLAATLCGQAARFIPRQTATKLKVTGVELFSAGDFALTEAREEIILHDHQAGRYQRLVLEQGQLKGAVLYGETSDGAWFFDKIQSGESVEHSRAKLIFGQAYAEDAA